MLKMKTFPTSACTLQEAVKMGIDAVVLVLAEM